MSNWGALLNYFMGQGSPSVEATYNANPGSNISQSMRYGQQGARQRNSRSNRSQMQPPQGYANWSNPFARFLPQMQVPQYGMALPGVGMPMAPPMQSMPVPSRQTMAAPNMQSMPVPQAQYGVYDARPGAGMPMVPTITPMQSAPVAAPPVRLPVQRPEIQRRF